MGGCIGRGGRKTEKERERSLSMCARDMLESRVSASRAFCVICSQALSLTLFLSISLSLALHPSG